MKQVPIYHPNLDRWVEVPESAVPQHKRAGWLTEKPVEETPDYSASRKRRNTSEE